MRLSLPAQAALFALIAASCRSHDAAKALTVSGIETYWIVDSPREGQNYISPAVRFRLKNLSSEPLTAVDARARFPAADQEGAWGSIQEQVSTWKTPLRPGDRKS